MCQQSKQTVGWIRWRNVRPPLQTYANVYSCWDWDDKPYTKINELALIDCY